jgi:hypothetical protein
MRGFDMTQEEWEAQKSLEQVRREREFAAGELKKAQKGAKKRDPEQFRRAVEFLAEWTGGLCARSSRPRPTFDPEWPTKLKGDHIRRLFPWC